MAFVIIPDNKPTRNLDLEGRVVECQQKYSTLETRMEYVERQVCDIQEQHRSSKKALTAITLALMTGVISVTANVMIKIFT